MKPERRTLEEEILFTHAAAIFEHELKTRLNLSTITAPLFVSSNSGLNDDLNGTEQAVSFQIDGQQFEVVHSLAKWKRWILGETETEKGKGIVTDMKAIRKEEISSPIHSHLVEQWDWEKVISKNERTLETLIDHAKLIYRALKTTEREISSLTISPPSLPANLYIIHSEELLKMYPTYSAKEREDAIAAKHGAVLIIGIGADLSDGKPHDLRAPDYDDWTSINADGFYGLNADLLVWDTVRKASLEISSMGIRVDKEALIRQLELTKSVSRLMSPFHQLLVTKQLPYTIGGGIGKSRVIMFVTKKDDISKVIPKTEILHSEIAIPTV